MWQWNIAQRQILLRRLDGIGQRRFAPAPQIISLRILSDQQSQLDVGHGRSAFHANGERIPDAVDYRRSRPCRDSRNPSGNGDLLRVIELSAVRPSQFRSRSPDGSSHGMPVSWTFRPGAWPIIRSWADRPACRTGRGPHGRWSAQCVHERMSSSSCVSVSCISVSFLDRTGR